MSHLSRVAEVGGRAVRYAEAGAGRPIVLLHAFPLSAEMWAPQLAAPPAGWRLIAPDLRGFRGPTTAGAAPEPATSPSMDDLAGDVAGLVDALGLRRAVVGGLSMGGYVAFGLLRRRPDLVEGLVLADTRASADSDEGREARRRLIALVRDRGPGAVADEMLPKLLGETTRRQRPDLVAHVRALVEANTAEAIADALGALMSRPDSTPLLSGIRVPALVVVGAEDTLTPPAEAEALYQAIPGARLAVVAGAGHLASLEQPEAFAIFLARFLAVLG